MRRPWGNFRLRLLLWHGVLSAMLITGFAFTIFHLERTRRYAEVDAQLTAHLSLLVDALRKEPRRDRASPLNASDALKELTHNSFSLPTGHYFAVWLREPVPALTSPHCPPEVQRPAVSSTAVQTRDHFREIHLAAAPVDVILVGTSVKGVNAELKRLSQRLVIIGLLLQCISLVPGIWLSKRTAAPIESIIRAARKIASGDLAERIRIGPDHGELSVLAEHLNASFAQLEELFLQQGRFTSDAAHELRTPVAVILSQSQSILRRDRSHEEYQEAIRAIARGAERMKGLLSTLLRLAKIDSREDPPTQLRVNLAAALSPHLALLRDECEASGVQILTEIAPCHALVDPAHLDVILSNLLNNALQHNVTNGSIRILTKTEPAQVSVQISNPSLPIPAEILPRLFDRFFQADPSRTGHHAGLGLSICQELTQLNHGSLSIQHESGLTTVLLTLKNADQAP